jgi:hypothetical protein
VERLPDYAERTVLLRVLALALIQHMFRWLAVRYPRRVTLASYPKLQRRPQTFVDSLVAFYGEPARSQAEAVLSASTVPAAAQDRLLWTSGASGAGRDPMSLSPTEVSSSYQMLADAGLAESHAWLDAWAAQAPDTAYHRAMGEKLASANTRPRQAAVD